MMLLDEAENPKDPSKGVVSRNLKLYSTPSFVPLIRSSGLSNSVQLPVCVKFVILTNKLQFVHMDPALKDRIPVCYNKYSASKTDMENNPIDKEFQVQRDPNWSTVWYPLMVYSTLHYWWWGGSPTCTWTPEKKIQAKSQRTPLIFLRAINIVNQNPRMHQTYLKKIF